MEAIRASAHEREDGTMDAIYRNLKFIDQYDPEHVLILSEITSIRWIMTVC